MSILIVTVEGSSGASWQLARRVADVTGVDPVRYRRQTAKRLEAKITDFDDDLVLIAGKSAGAAKIIDALSTKGAIRWASSRKVVVLSIDCHRPGSQRWAEIYELQNPHVRRCFCTYQRARWPRGAAVFCSSGNNTIVKQYGVNHASIIYSLDTERLIMGAYLYTMEARGG
jgi:hypothetical protein